MNLSTEQEIVLHDIANAMRWAFMRPVAAIDRSLIPERVGDNDFVHVRIMVNGEIRLRSSIRARSLPDVAEMIAKRLSATHWNALISTIVETGDGVIHIIKTMDDRTRPAHPHGHGELHDA